MMFCLLKDILKNKEKRNKSKHTGKDMPNTIEEMMDLFFIMMFSIHNCYITQSTTSSTQNDNKILLCYCFLIHL